MSGAEILVHLRDENVVVVGAKALPAVDQIGLIPSLPLAGALGAAQDYVARRYGVAGIQYSTPELEVFNRGLFAGTRYHTRLAWFVIARAPGIQEYVWIDAHNGSILLSFNQRPEALDRQIYDSMATSALPGTLCREEGDPASGDADCDAAYDFSGDTYNYFLSSHGRDSYDGAGATISASVDFCLDGDPCPWPNAFWDSDSQRLVLGAGFATDDVVAHEITHGLVDATANLFYYMQSGALNESFADIFGEVVDLGNGAGNDAAGVRWHIGEDLAGGSIRNMMDPNSPASGDPDPAKMSDPAFVCGDPLPDSGGVHSNSGVPNHAFALMVDGGTFNSLTVSGIGLTKAAEIQYRALTVHLLSASDFLDNYNALQQSCAELIGMVGITQNDCDEVMKALDAVEMSAVWPCGSAQPGVMGCPAGFEATELFSDDLENPASGNWVVKNLSGVTHWSYPPDSFFTFATSGILNLLGEDLGSIGDSVIEMTADVAIPQEGARFEFKHAFGFENQPNFGGVNVDGGLVEYSLDGGLTWLDAGPMISAGAGYSAGLTGIFGGDNPLAGRSAFGGDSFGYTATQVDLSTLTGEGVRFRFRIGTDDSVGDFGWYIDDIRIVECTSAPDGAPTLTAPVPGSLLMPPAATFMWTADGQPVTGWQLLVGTVVGTSDLFDSGVLPSDQIAVDVTGIAYERLTVFVRLQFEIGGSWEHIDYGFTVGGSIAFFGIVEDIALADFNNDGNLDVAVPVRLGSNRFGFVEILQGDGMGKLRLTANRARVGLDPLALAAGDFNADLKQDIAVVHDDSNDVSILLGDGTGNFAAPISIILASPALFGSDIAAGHMDSDTNLDLLVVRQDFGDFGSNVRVLLGDGTGMFTPSGTATTEGFSLPRSVVLADFNKDGQLDVATGNGNTGDEGVAVFLGDGLGGLGAATSYAVPFVSTVASSDFNLDGSPDILTTSGSLLIGDGMGDFTIHPTGIGATDLATVDFNRDGNPDIVRVNGFLNNSTNPHAGVFLGNGIGGFALAAIYRVGEDPELIAAGDLNNDDRPDIVTKSDAGIAVVLNTGEFDPPPNDLDLSNETISEPNVYEACNSITLGPNLLITPDATAVTFRAPNILVLAVTEIELGASVTFDTSVPSGCSVE